MEIIIYLLNLVPIYFIQCGDGVDYNGQYISPPTHIEICIKENKEEMKKTIIHELGHYFWYNYLNNEERNNWKILYDNSYPDDFISWRAMTNEKEDFAEIFASIYYPQQYMDTGLLKLKVYYMKKLINKYLITK